MNISDAPRAESIALSVHAVEQYRHRVKPGLDTDATRGELEQLRLVGEVWAAPPAWLHPRRPLAYYLTIGESIVLPVASQAGGWIATTCVTQQTLTPTGRTAKSARKASLQSRKRAQRRAGF